MKLIHICLLVFPACFGLTIQAADKKPNVLFIAVDDLNAWVTHLGRNTQALTPNIDRLASRGVTFEKAYCAVPACEPSRAALMSGQRPWTTGCYSNGDEWLQIITEGHGLSARFKEAGYHVAGSGKIYHSDERFESEWSEYMDGRPYKNDGGAPKDQGYHEPLLLDMKDEDISDWHTVNWCIERLKNAGDKPLFLACGLHKPHLPFAVPRKYYDLFPLEEIKLPPFLESDLDDLPPVGVKMAGAAGDYAKFQKSGRWKNAIQSYLATCAYTDMNIGRLLDALDRSSIRDNTIVVLWGDHGWSLGEKKHFRKFALWEEPTRMPFIWVVPGMTKPGTRSTRPVDLMSIYPTLSELAGLPLPKYVEGKSIVPLLKNPKARWNTPAITTHGFKNHAVRSEDWRYIRYVDGGEELYDHRKDPYEWTNLASDPKFAKVKKELGAWLPSKEVPPWPGKQ